MSRITEAKIRRIIREELESLNPVDENVIIFDAEEPDWYRESWPMSQVISYHGPIVISNPGQLPPGPRAEYQNIITWDPDFAPNFLGYIAPRRTPSAADEAGGRGWLVFRETPTTSQYL